MRPPSRFLVLGEALITSGNSLPLESRTRNRAYAPQRNGPAAGLNGAPKWRVRRSRCGAGAPPPPSIRSNLRSPPPPPRRGWCGAGRLDILAVPFARDRALTPSRPRLTATTRAYREGKTVAGQRPARAGNYNILVAAETPSMHMTPLCASGANDRAPSDPGQTMVLRIRV